MFAAYLWISGHVAQSDAESWRRFFRVVYGGAAVLLLLANALVTDLIAVARPATRGQGGKLLAGVLGVAVAIAAAWVTQ